MALSAPANVPHHASSCLQPQLRTESLALPFTSHLGSQDSGHTMISEWITEGKGRRVACLNRNFAGLSKGTLLRIKNCHYSCKRIKNIHVQTALPFQSSVFGKSVSPSGEFPAYQPGSQWTISSGVWGFVFGLVFWGFFWVFLRRNPKTFKIPEARGNPPTTRKGCSHTIISLLVLANEPICLVYLKQTHIFEGPWASLRITCKPAFPISCPVTMSVPYLVHRHMPTVTN